MHTTRNRLTRSTAETVNFALVGFFAGVLMMVSSIPFDD
jgi:predicted Co/Zn/Cd cation transporter (cation efflux family)